MKSCGIEADVGKHRKNHGDCTICTKSHSLRLKSVARKDLAAKIVYVFASNTMHTPTAYRWTLNPNSRNSCRYKACLKTHILTSLSPSETVMYFTVHSSDHPLCGLKE